MQRLRRAIHPSARRVARLIIPLALLAALAVTIGLARMISKCMPRQILIGDFSRPADHEADPANPLDFVLKADGALARFNGVHMHGHTISAIRCYMTGAKRDAGRFAVKRFRIADKHGRPHDVYNQKFNVYLSNDRKASGNIDALYLGLQQSDLAKFEATEVAEIAIN